VARDIERRLTPRQCHVYRLTARHCVAPFFHVEGNPK
jgi:hypothetical protein